MQIALLHQRVEAIDQAFHLHIFAGQIIQQALTFAGGGEVLLAFDVGHFFFLATPRGLFDQGGELATQADALVGSQFRHLQHSLQQQFHILLHAGGIDHHAIARAIHFHVGVGDYFLLNHALQLFGGAEQVAGLRTGIVGGLRWRRNFSRDHLHLAVVDGVFQHQSVGIVRIHTHGGVGKLFGLLHVSRRGGCAAKLREILRIGIQHAASFPQTFRTERGQTVAAVGFGGIDELRQVGVVVVRLGGLNVPVQIDRFTCDLAFDGHFERLIGGTFADQHGVSVGTERRSIRGINFGQRGRQFAVGGPNDRFVQSAAELRANFAAGNLFAINRHDAAGLIRQRRQIGDVLARPHGETADGNALLCELVDQLGHFGEAALALLRPLPMYTTVRGAAGAFW